MPGLTKIQSLACIFLNTISGVVEVVVEVVVVGVVVVVVVVVVDDATEVPIGVGSVT